MRIDLFYVGDRKMFFIYLGTLSFTKRAAALKVDADSLIKRIYMHIHGPFLLAKCLVLIVDWIRSFDITIFFNLHILAL